MHKLYKSFLCVAELDTVTRMCGPTFLEKERRQAFVSDVINIEDTLIVGRHTMLSRVFRPSRVGITL